MKKVIGADATVNGTGMAVIGITDETIISRYNNERYRVIFVVSDGKDQEVPSFKKVPEREMQQIIPGKYFEDGRLFGFRLIFPREEDLIAREEIESNSVAIYKLWCYRDLYFSDGEIEKYLSLAKKVRELAMCRLVLPSKTDVCHFVQSLFCGVFSVRGETRGKFVTLDTPCHDFFHADVDGVDHCIARPIEERFGLEHFGVTYGLSNHSYATIGKESSFFKKYPESSIGSNEFTLRRLCAMVYDLVRMRHGLSPL